MKTSGELRNSFYKWLEDNPDGKVWDWMYKILKEESNRVQPQVKPEIAEELYKECSDYAYTQVPKINTDENMADYWRKAFFYLYTKFKHIRDTEQFSV